jgi:hypothetical protein
MPASIRKPASRPSALLAALVIAISPACGDTQDGLRPGELLIDQWAGNLDVDAFFALPEIRSELEALLGDELELLIFNLDVKGDIDLVRGALSVAGNAPHGGTEEEAVVCVLPGTLAVHAAILSAGQITVYTRGASYEALPLCIKDWITLVKAAYVDRFEQPGSVTVLQR